MMEVDGILAHIHSSSVFYSPPTHILLPSINFPSCFHSFWFGLVLTLQPTDFNPSSLQGHGYEAVHWSRTIHRPPYLRRGLILNPELIDLNRLASQRLRGPGDQLVFHTAPRLLIPPII